jgi:hypothetical protein
MLVSPSSFPSVAIRKRLRSRTERRPLANQQAARYLSGVRSKSITAAPAIEALFAVLSKAPGLGSRSARRTALQVLKKKDQSTADRAR